MTFCPDLHVLLYGNDLTGALRLKRMTEGEVIRKIRLAVARNLKDKKAGSGRSSPW